MSVNIARFLLTYVAKRALVYIRPKEKCIA